MKFIVSTIFILTLFVTGQGQIKNLEHVNKKTNQWIGLISVSKYVEYHLLSKQADSCTSKIIKVPRDHDDAFIDSLEKCGFNKKVKHLNKSKDYKVRVDLISCAFEKLKVGTVDSLFNYNYKVTLTNLKTSKSQTVYNLRLGAEKEKTLKAFSTHDYVVKNIAEIKGTSIIMVDIYSTGIYTQDKVLFIFSPTHSYYF
jgi:hypothetical protein